MKFVFAIVSVVAAIISILGAAAVVQQFSYSESFALIKVRNRSGVAPMHQQFIQWQADALRRPEALGRVIATPEIARLRCVQLQSEPQQWLQDALVITVPEQSEIIITHLRIEGDDETAELILDRILDVYIADVVSAERSRNSRRLDECKTQLNSIRDEIENARQERHALNLIGQEQASKHQVARVTELDGDIMDAEFRMAQLESEIERFGLDWSGEVNIGVVQRASASRGILKRMVKHGEDFSKQVATSSRLNRLPSMIQSPVRRFCEYVAD